MQHRGPSPEHFYPVMEVGGRSADRFAPFMHPARSKGRPFTLTQAAQRCERRAFWSIGRDLRSKSGPFCCTAGAQRCIDGSLTSSHGALRSIDGAQSPIRTGTYPVLPQIATRIGLPLARRHCHNQSQAVVPAGMTKQHQLEESNGTKPDLSSDQHG